MPISSPYEAFKNAPSGYFSDAEIERFRPKTGFKNSFFNYGQSGSTEKKGGLEQAGNLAKQFLQKSEKRRERDEMIAAYSRMAAQPFGGAGLAGRQFTLGDGSLTQINPDTFEPIVIPAGGAGVAGGRSTGQRLAGAATGALGGAAAGAKFGSVLGLPGAAVGAVIGGLGGLFG
jgi:hypothetical protein